MRYISSDPFTGRQLAEFDFEGFPDLQKMQQAFGEWSGMSVQKRIRAFEKLEQLMESGQEACAVLMTTEMGKPLEESRSELIKCRKLIRYYAEHAEGFLQAKTIRTEAKESYVSFEPLGILFLIMPWNFPFWQVFRCAVPAMIAGNVCLLKHAPNVPQCARAIEKLFSDAGFPEAAFKNVFLSNEMAATVLANEHIAGLSFTGSDSTGSHLAGLAGSFLKKTVMELGGNDPFIVLADADLEKAVEAAITSRSINGGQACNGAKRFIVDTSVAERFTVMLITAIRELKVGDPTDPQTAIGPMARIDLAQKVHRQIADTVAQGAIPHRGMEPPRGNEQFVQPVLLSNVKPGMCAFEEELFGPVWSVSVANDEEDAIRLANTSRFGLGASLWTGDPVKAKKVIPQLQAGNVFVNDFVRSDPRLPFGGVKRSGFGRELSEWGLMEFVNIKTVYIH